MADELKCEHCGSVCEDDWELQVFHRGCRLRAAFPEACAAEGGLLKFDMAKVSELLDKDTEK